MTDYNNKVRAVILAALMVFSVFAGTVALSGTAAA
ncbi:MAG: surface glycoprotein, partial [Haloplanus sp.]